MFLKKLTVLARGQVVRVVEFRRGLNLVVDETTAARTDSGNNVGKTTFLRSVDFCLGGAAEALYRDHEFPDRVNEAVLKFLQSGAEFRLELESPVGRVRTVRRDLAGLLAIDDREFAGIKAFQAELGRILFGLEDEKPTLRQLLGKFIRIDDHQLNNVIKYLHPATSGSVYEAIYLFLFGFPDQSLLARRHRLLLKSKQLSNQKVALKARSPATLAQVIAVLDRDIAELEGQVAAFAVGPEHAARLSELSGVRAKLAETAIQKSELDIRLSASRRTIRELEQATVEIDTDTLRELYEEATRLPIEISRTFEELLAFHNKMMRNKAQYVISTLEALEAEEGRLQMVLNGLLDREAKLLRGLGAEGVFSDLLEIQRRLEALHEERGRKSSLMAEVQKVEDELKDCSKGIDEVETAIGAYMEDLQARMTDFNLIFSHVSKKLYEEEYVFTLEVTENGKQFVTMGLHNVQGNEGTGKTRAKIVAFDLSYVMMAARFGVKAPRFVMHDQLEVVAANQLATLFEMAEELDGQFVVSILNDRLDAVALDWVDNAVILRLSQDDKFFRLEAHGAPAERALDE